VPKDVSTDELRAQLVSVLRRGADLHAQLIELAERADIDLVQLADQVDVLERLDDERDGLLQQLRRDSVRNIRKPQDERTNRQLVFESLDELGGFPQRSALVRDYVLARFNVDIQTRVFAVLRRDEHNSWDANPDKRSAYVLPALSADGTPVAGTLASSAWPLSQRLMISEESERVAALVALDRMLRYDGQISRVPTRRRVDLLIERMGQEMLDGPMLPEVVESQKIVKWRESIAQRIASELVALQGTDQAARAATATELEAALLPHDRLWGTGSLQDDFTRIASDLSKRNAKLEPYAQFARQVGELVPDLDESISEDTLRRLIAMRRSGTNFPFTGYEPSLLSEGDRSGQRRAVLELWFAALEEAGDELTLAMWRDAALVEDGRLPEPDEMTAAEIREAMRTGNTQKVAPEDAARLMLGYFNSRYVKARGGDD
jgi:hypothetical protein